MMGDGKSDLDERFTEDEMILNGKSLEKRLKDVGITTVQLCYDTLTLLDQVEFSRYSELLTVGYDAMNHRKARLMNYYMATDKPWFGMDKFYEERMKTFVKKRMVGYVNKHHVTQPRSGLRRFFS